MSNLFNKTCTYITFKSAVKQLSNGYRRGQTCPPSRDNYSGYTFKGKENGKTIMRASISYTLYYRIVCMHWLTYVRLNRKDRLKNMRGTTLKVAMCLPICEGLFRLDA